jgi:Asp-tRNA(Asn)/Glu-tRNA(Gln) amidotransferase A subunit family amidase
MAWGVTTPQIAHPLSKDHITGGSSGGSAACVAAGVAKAGLGTDTGGSVRIPAALCGVVGFRPTTGSVDMAGVTPLAPEQDVVGPMAADVATCATVLEVLLGRPLQPSEPPATASQGMRIGILARPGRLEPAVEAAFLDTVESLREAGVEIIECDTALARRAGSISLLTMLHSSAQLFSRSARQNPAGFGDEARALLTVGDAITDQDAQVLRQGRDTLVARTARLFAENRLDAFLTPTTPCTAPKRFAEDVEIAHRSEPVSAALTRFTAWASATSMPAVSVPAAAPDLPIGVQVMAPPGHEETCVRLAFTIEEHTRKKAT